jgi:hypothetical protein
MAKHKHYDLIVAWAEGKIIQVSGLVDGTWNDWPSSIFPDLCGRYEYRVKPEPKPDVKSYYHAHSGGIATIARAEYNLALTFDGETGKLKSAKVLNQEGE